MLSSMVHSHDALALGLSNLLLMRWLWRGMLGLHWALCYV